MSGRYQTGRRGITNVRGTKREAPSQTPSTFKRTTDAKSYQVGLLYFLSPINMGDRRLCIRFIGLRLGGSAHVMKESACRGKG